MKVEQRIKRASDERIRRYHELLDRIAARNDTGLSDATVLAILDADRGAWTSYASVEDMFAALDIDPSGLR